MTPRAGVKTTLASEMRLPGLPDPKRGPHFFLAATLARTHLFTPEFLADPTCWFGLFTKGQNLV
jgi:hypothetical protein